MGSKIYFFFKIVTITTFLGLIFIFIGGMGIYLHYSRELPNIVTLADYKPKVVSSVYDKNGNRIGEFYRENRQIIEYNKIPKMVVDAFVASEDGKFFEHKGLDFAGIVRAMVANFRSGKFSQGGSTITQQVARSLMLSSEKKISRKVKEAILAGRIETKLSKHDILFLYLNQIFLGHNAYGVASASRLYFNKDIKDITLAEAALLAGLPQAPSGWSPFFNPNKAKERQIYVLTRMMEDGYISRDQAERAANERIKLFKRIDININSAPYFVELVRRYMATKYGDNTILDEGVSIYTSLDLDLQEQAQKAVMDGLKSLDKRQGFRGAIKRLKNDAEIEKGILEINKEILAEVREYIYFPEPWQEFKVRNKMFFVEDKKDSKELNREKIPVPLDKGKNYKAIVKEIDEKLKQIKIMVGYNEGVIQKDGYAWVYGDRLNNEILRKGDVILVTMLSKGIFAIEQEPELEAALLSLSIEDGSIKAMVGGYDYSASEFNRAYQAKRQAGSTFKPLIYAGALDKNYTPASIIMDSPIVYEDEEADTTWKPTNYSESFYGDTTFRDALVFSRNIPTTRILEDIKVSYAIDYAKRLGIKSDMPRDLSLGLGSTAVSLWEMTKSFSVFASGGKRVTPYFISKVETRSGNILEEHKLGISVDPILGADQETVVKKEEENSEEENKNDYEFPPKGYVIPPQTAFIMNLLLKDAATHGTGAKATATLGVTLAGKTGTSNNFCDAWFIGYTPKVATGVWVGYDDQAKSIGQGQTGASAALPIWIQYMGNAIKKYPAGNFSPPEGIKFVRVDGKTGKLASASSTKVLYLPFKEGTEPGRADIQTESQDTDQTQFFRENF